MSSTWKAVAGIVLIFALGCVSGALSTMVFFRQQALSLERSPSEVADIMENRFTRRLDLDPDQHRQIHVILMDYLQQRRQVLVKVQPDMRMLNQQMMAQIRDVLHPDQLAGFRENLEALRRRMARAAVRPTVLDATLPEVGSGAGTNAAPVGPAPVAQ